MIQTVILDLDGPILDGEFRHYACYQKILANHGYAPVSIENYWQMKRDRMDLRQQLSASGAEAIYSDFKRSWLELIEQPEMLDLDRVQPGAKQKLVEWREQGLSLALVTLRRHPERLHAQLAHLGLTFLFDYILVSDHSKGGVGKAEKVKQTLAEQPATALLWIGDTEVDVEAARWLGCPVWAVSCGVRTERYLASLAPDFLSRDITSVDLSSLP